MANCPPGWEPAVRLVRSSAELTVVPLTETITSPLDRPACDAGAPWYAWQISAPELTGELKPPKPPKPSPPLLHPADASATLTPMKPARPMCTTEVALPELIWLAMDSAVLIGIAKPVVVVESGPYPEEFAAVSMPITAPSPLTSGPPESPCWMGAFVSIMPCSCSVVPAPLSLALMDWSRPWMVPCAVDGRPPWPPALPSASTAWPTLALLESDSVTVCSPEAPTSWSRATSSVESYQTTRAV